MSFVIPPSPQPSVEIAGSGERFPVHRIYCVGRNYAKHAREMGMDPDREPPFFFSKPADAVVAKAKALMETLRCLVCQGQSIADSDAPLAGDMRHEVRTKIAAGESPDAIRKWLVARYGNWVTYDPPLDAATALLWFGPLLFLALGGWLAFGRFRRGETDGESEI